MTKDKLETLLLKFCTEKEGEGAGSSCMEYWGLENRDDWCEGCKSIVVLEAALTSFGNEMLIAMGEE